MKRTLIVTALLIASCGAERGRVALATLDKIEGSVREAHAAISAADRAVMVQIASTAESVEQAEAARRVHEARMAVVYDKLSRAYLALAAAATAAAAGAEPDMRRALMALNDLVTAWEGR